MASQKQIEANRRNALKSTGPKTAEGKAVVRLNALQHGVTAEAAVVPFVEHPADWEAHRAGVLDSLAPSGHLETILAERVAMLLWRLGRANRYERELIAVEQEQIEAKHFRYGPHNSLDSLRHTVMANRRLQRIMEQLPAMKPTKAIAPLDAVSIIQAVAGVTQKINFDNFFLPGIPADVYLEKYAGWTAGLVRDAITAMAQGEGKPFDELLSMAKSKLVEEEAKLALEKAELEIDHKRRANLLPETKTLDTLARYEAHLERSLYKTLHEIERLKALRQGQPVPPPVAVDVTVSVP